MTKGIRIEWLEMKPATGNYSGLEPGLRAGLDDDGNVWAWAGLVNSKAVALLMANEDGEPHIVDQGEEFLRVNWLRLKLGEDPLSGLLLDLIEDQVRKCRLH